MSDEEDSGDDEDVGYRRPPKAKQFKKGQSGNPGGRPRRKTNFDVEANMDAEIAKVILAEASRPVPIRENGRRQDVSMKTALLRTLNHSALKGDLRSQVEALKLILVAERFTVQQKAGPGGRCPQCAELAAMSDDELVAEIMQLQETGRLKLPDGAVLVEVDDDDPWGVG